MIIKYNLKTQNEYSINLPRYKYLPETIRNLFKTTVLYIFTFIFHFIIHTYIKFIYYRIILQNRK
jgi:hypothetical protein